jgi:hypothetical protein
VVIGLPGRPEADVDDEDKRAVGELRALAAVRAELGDEGRQPGPAVRVALPALEAEDLGKT